jgi:hypothetical protein
MDDINSPSPSLVPDTLAFAIGNRSLQFMFSATLLVQAARPIDLDIWSVRVTADDGPSRLFTYKMGTRSRDRGPDPLGVLKGIASDVALALQLPPTQPNAIDFLFAEGYAVWPSDCLLMLHNLMEAHADLSHVIGETGITPAEFVAAVQALPYTPRCTVPMPCLSASS